MRLAPLLTAVLVLSPQVWAANDRETKVRSDRERVESDEHWIYNDLDRAFGEARESGKPLLVVFRCIPCEACSEFDEQVVRRHPQARDLMDQFVCVRVVQANDMDLSLFQFDYDQSFAAFLMNADKVIYGRFGTRSASRDEKQDMTMQGFARALEGALELHRQYPANKAALAGKHGPRPLVSVPQEFPSLQGKYGPELDYKGNVVQSCIHCHQVREGERLVYRQAGKPVPDPVLYPYPNPDVVGLKMDPNKTAVVKTVLEGSAAEQAGFRDGDRLLTLEGQPLLSIADVQWVLHNAEDSDTLTASVQRDGRTFDLQLPLEQGWRKRSDISWRATSWDLRRMATGGLKLEPLTAEEREECGLAADRLALRVAHVGQYGAHAAAKRAGFLKDDVLIEIDGRTEPMTETDLFALVMQETEPGTPLPVTVLRQGKQLRMKLPTQ